MKLEITGNEKDGYVWNVEDGNPQEILVVSALLIKDVCGRFNYPVKNIVESLFELGEKS